MATTTNYGWTTPDDTALVKDGAAAIRTLGSSVDTTTKNLNPETTLGDIAYRSSTANVKTRLGIGSTGQVLTVASGVPSWATLSAGGKTLLSTTTLSGTSTSITSIDQGYKDLFLIGNIITASATGISLRFNSNSTVGDYSSYRNYLEAGGSFSYADVNGGDIGQSDSNTAWNTQNYTNLTIFRYAETESKQTFSFVRSVVGGFVRGMYEHGAFNSTTAITSIQIGAGATLSGTVYLYGVK